MMTVDMIPVSTIHIALPIRANVLWIWQGSVGTAPTSKTKFNRAGLIYIHPFGWLKGGWNEGKYTTPRIECCDKIRPVLPYFLRVWESDKTCFFPWDLYPLTVTQSEGFGWQDLLPKMNTWKLHCGGPSDVVKQSISVGFQVPLSYLCHGRTFIFSLGDEDSTKKTTELVSRVNWR